MTWKLWTPKICSWGRILSLHYVFCPGVTVKDSDYQKGSPIWEEQHNQFLYLCNRTWTKEPWSLCYLVVFFGFHSHCLHSNVTWFSVVLVARKHIGFRLEWSNCCVALFHQICFILRNFLAWCERNIFPHLNVTFDKISSTFSFVIHWYEKFLMAAGNCADLTITQVPNLPNRFRL